MSTAVVEFGAASIYLRSTPSETAMKVVESFPWTGRTNLYVQELTSCVHFVCLI